MQVIGLVLAFSLTLLPLAARAQESGKVYKIGWLASFPLEVQGKTRPGSAVAWRAFTDGLRDLGWVENQNFVFVYRYSEGRPSDILASRQSSLPSSRTSSARARANWRFVHSREPPRRFRSSCRFRPIQWEAGWSPVSRGRLAHEVRVSHKSQDRQGARADDSPVALGAGDQVIE
jgi:hypothetical protein